MYSDLMALLLEIINSVMSHNLQFNPQLAYALLHRRDMFARMEGEPRFKELVQNINTVRLTNKCSSLHLQIDVPPSIGC